MTLVRRRFKGIHCCDCDAELMAPWWRNPWFWMGFRSVFDIIGRWTKRETERLQAGLHHVCPEMERRRRAHRETVLSMCDNDEMRDLLARHFPV